MKRKTVTLWCVNYSFEIGYHTYPIKVYAGPRVESELESPNVFSTEEEALATELERQIKYDAKHGRA